MQATTYTKTGAKSSTKTKLNSNIFGLSVESNDLIKRAYMSVLSGQRSSLAKVKTRTMVRGGGRKPWQQKGTGNARAGSIRSPLWRGGGITFGPTGEENHKLTLSKTMRRIALKQALSVSADKITVVEAHIYMDKKTKDFVKFLDKIGASRKILCIVSKKNDAQELAARNVANVTIVGAEYLNVNQVLDADTIVISNESLGILDNWLDPKAEAKKESK